MADIALDRASLYSKEGFESLIDHFDEKGDLNVIRLSLENFLDARSGGKGGIVTYRQWATFDLIQGYDLAEARRDRAPGEK